LRLIARRAVAHEVDDIAYGFAPPNILRP
jgi:hypothetical protein